MENERQTTHHRFVVLRGHFLVLAGKTVDTNSAFLAKGLFDVGIDLKRIEVIADDEEEVSSGSLSLRKEDSGGTMIHDADKSVFRSSKLFVECTPNTI